MSSKEAALSRRHAVGRNERPGTRPGRGRSACLYRDRRSDARGSQREKPNRERLQRTAGEGEREGQRRRPPARGISSTREPESPTQEPETRSLLPCPSPENLNPHLKTRRHTQEPEPASRHRSGFYCAGACGPPGRSSRASRRTPPYRRRRRRPLSATKRRIEVISPNFRPAGAPTSSAEEFSSGQARELGVWGPLK